MADGSKLDAAIQSAVVAFEVDRYGASRRDRWSVVVKGRVELATDESTLARLRTTGLRPWSTAMSRPDWVVVRADAVSGRSWPCLGRWRGEVEERCDGCGQFPETAAPADVRLGVGTDDNGPVSAATHRCDRTAGVTLVGGAAAGAPGGNAEAAQTSIQARRSQLRRRRP